jgi:phage-related protein
VKDIRFCGRSLEALRSFQATAKREAGYQLDRVQHGLEPADWKPMPSIGPGVREIRIMHEGQFRVIYIAKLADAVYVLHAFQKKTQKTRKQDIDAATHALKQLK